MSTHLDDKSINYGDYIYFEPIWGRKRKIKLRRTSYFIKVSRSLEFKVSGNHIFLPSLDDKELTFKLELSQTAPTSEQKYIVTSCDNFFSINGIKTNFAFLEDGSVLSLKFNKLLFRKYEIERSVDDDQKEIPISVLRSQIPIFLYGETGVGKTRLAKSIHSSSNKLGNFVHLNISSFSRSLVESELFGHVKGAFTGATYDKKGAFLEAKNGTLFIDEIDSLDYDIQTKLLLFLDNQCFRKVGASYEEKTQVRIIFSSGKSPDQLLKSNKFRDDFYYRITSGYTLHLKSLRCDKEKLLRIIDSFFCKQGKTPTSRLINFYVEYSWPGNYRQLKGHIETKCHLNSSNIVDLDEFDYKLDKIHSLDNSLENEGWIKLDYVKKQYIKRAFVAFNSNVQRTAFALGITPNTVRANLNEAKLLRVSGSSA